MVPRRTLEHRLRARYATPRFSHNTSLSPLFERIEVDFLKKRVQAALTVQTNAGAYAYIVLTC